MPRGRPEHQLQKAIMALWALRGRRDLDLFAIPNGGARDAVTGAILKAEGVRAGVPDLCLIRDGGRVGWIECKSHKGRLSEEQKHIRERWKARGHDYVIVKDVKDAAIILTLWNALRGVGKDSAE